MVLERAAPALPVELSPADSPAEAFEVSWLVLGDDMPGVPFGGWGLEEIEKIERAKFGLLEIEYVFVTLGGGSEGGRGTRGTIVV